MGVWQELENMAVDNTWDIIIMLESHWQGGIKGRTIPGYTLHQKQRPAGAKKGGGIVCLVRNSLAAYEWPGRNSPNQPEESSANIDAESLWIIVQSEAGDMAVGAVYYAAGGGANC